MCISTAESVLVQSNINLILPRAREFPFGGIGPVTSPIRRNAWQANKNYKSHSFRISAATTAWANGFSGEQIQQMEPWNSKAFTKYIRIPMLKI
jgi:hypothetical protein